MSYTCSTITLVRVFSLSVTERSANQMKVLSPGAAAARYLTRGLNSQAASLGGRRVAQRWTTNAEEQDLCSAGGLHGCSTAVELQFCNSGLPRSAIRAAAVISA